MRTRGASDSWSCNVGPCLVEGQAPRLPLPLEGRHASILGTGGQGTQNPWAYVPDFGCPAPPPPDPGVSGHDSFHVFFP